MLLSDGPPAPDLVVVDVSWTSSLGVGDSAVPVATILNRGTAATPDGVAVGVSFAIDGTQIAWSDTDTASLAPGATVTLAADGGPNGGNTWTVLPGSHTLVATVDDVDRVPDESDEANNTLTTSTSVGQPDLVISNVGVGSQWAAGGRRVAHATVTNAGTAATPAGVVVGVSFSVDGTQIAWSDTDTAPLAPGASVTLTANNGPTGTNTWNATAGTHTLAATVDDVNRIPNELNETNNTLTTTVIINSTTAQADPPTTTPPAITTPPVTTPVTTPPVTTPVTTPVTAPVSGAGHAASDKLGFNPASADPAVLTNTENWLGRQVGYVELNGDVSSPDNLKSSIWAEFIQPGHYQTLSNRLNLSLSLPLAFGNFVDTNTPAGITTVTPRLQDVAHGTYDDAYTYTANALKNAGYGDATIRLGWEYDGTWMPWSSPNNCTNYIAAYRHVHDLMRTISPNFKFDYNGTSGYFTNTTATCAYPGDNYVDIIGLDIYDMALGTNLYNPTTGTWTNPQTTFQTILLPRLQTQRDFAITHGKQVSYPEWALSGGGYQLPTNHGGDNPNFIQNMYNWFNNLPTTGPGSLAYHAYFQENTPHDGPHNITNFPNAATTFKQLFNH